jgi:hypothetical protein
MLVDRRAHDDDDALRAGDDGRIVGCIDQGAIEGPAQCRFSAWLLKGQIATSNELDDLLVDVVESDSQTLLSEAEAERQADMAAAPNDRDVEIEWQEFRQAGGQNRGTI